MSCHIFVSYTKYSGVIKTADSYSDKNLALTNMNAAPSWELEFAIKITIF